MMAGSWVCPDCGMKSSRHWNVERHISRFHEGTGSPLGEMKYIIMQLRNELPDPTYPRNIRPGSSGGKDLLTIFDQRVKESISKFVEGIGEKEVVQIRGRVCVDCLNVILIKQLKGGMLPSQSGDHQCDPSWLLLHPSIDERKERLVAKRLQSNLPYVLLRALKKLSRVRTWLLSAHEEHSKIAWKKSAIYKPLMEKSKETSDLKTAVPIIIGLQDLAEKEKQFSSSYHPLNTERYQWAKRLFQQELPIFTEINEEELLEFFKIANSSEIRIRKMNSDGYTHYFVLRITITGSYPHVIGAN